MNFEKVRLPPGLYFVATPIGTARDITLRALDVLASADVIAAEDTRSLRRLMDIHGIPLEGRKPIAYHDHSSSGTRKQLLDAVAQGKSVAYASEAGMPLIADPGYDLSRQAAEAGHLVTVAPGASAILAALVLAGLPTDAFFFGGFLPNTAQARRTRLTQLAGIPGTLVFYESPNRVAATLTDMVRVFGPDRPAVMCRELTKKFEEVRRGSLSDIEASVAASKPKGEIVLLVDRARSETVSETDLEMALRDALKTHSVRDAADLVSGVHNVPRRKVYNLALQLAKR